MPRPHELEEGLRFDEFARTYDDPQQPHTIRDAVRQRVIDEVRAADASVVLDIGCGTGRALVALSPHIRLGIGVDVSPKMLQAAEQAARRHGCQNLRFHFGSFHDLENPHAFWDPPELPDVNMQCYALHHLPQAEKRAALTNMARSLDPSRGAIILGDLMFFEQPQGLESLYEEAGYNPAADRPESAELVGRMLEELAFRVELIRLHPLAGLVIGRRP